MRRPAEAKKLIANLLAAPGRVDVTPDTIRIRLAPAANRNERAALLVRALRRYVGRPSR